MYDNRKNSPICFFINGTFCNKIHQVFKGVTSGLVTSWPKAAACAERDNKKTGTFNVPVLIDGEFLSVTQFVIKFNADQP